MALLKAPDSAAAVTVTFPDPPDEIVSNEGFAPSETVVVPVAAMQLVVTLTAPEIWFVMLGLPTACTYNV